MIHTENTPLQLRPHHLLCLQTFVGRGYSEEFVSQMTSVKKQLTADPSTPIRLVTGADDLCAHCPNCADGHCTSDKPEQFDRNVLQKLGTDTTPVHGIPASLTLTGALLEECCPGCEWMSLCREVLGVI